MGGGEGRKGLLLLKFSKIFVLEKMKQLDPKPIGQDLKFHNTCIFNKSL